MLRTTIELNEEDIEVLLDALGVPDESDEIKMHARRKLEEAMLYLRKLGSLA